MGSVLLEGGNPLEFVLLGILLKRQEFSRAAAQTFLVGGVTAASPSVAGAGDGGGGGSAAVCQRQSGRRRDRGVGGRAGGGVAPALGAAVGVGREQGNLGGHRVLEARVRQGIPVRRRGSVRVDRRVGVERVAG